MKKSMCIVISVLLVCLFSTALAAVPSKTTGDLTDFIGAVDESGASLTDTGFAITTTAAAPADGKATDGKTVDSTKKLTKADLLLKDIAQFIKQKKASPIQYFGDDVLAQAATLLPAGTDMNAMSLNEFFSASIAGYNKAFGNVTADFTFASEYVPGQKVLAIVGLPTADQVAWYPMQAECGENGVVAIHLTSDLLTLAQQSETIIAILSEQAA